MEKDKKKHFLKSNKISIHKSPNSADLSVSKEDLIQLNIKKLKIITSPKDNLQLNPTEDKSKLNSKKHKNQPEIQKDIKKDVDYQLLEKNLKSQINTALGVVEDKPNRQKKQWFKFKLFNKTPKIDPKPKEKEEDLILKLDVENSIDNLEQAKKASQEPNTVKENNVTNSSNFDINDSIGKGIPAIKIINCTKGFKGFVAVNNASFEVSQGVIHGFLGPNGSGKTTIIKSIIGSLILTRGQILVGGYRAGTVEAKQLIGYIPESANFPKQMKALEYIVNMARLSGVNQKKAIKISESILKTLNLWQFRNKRPSSFSSGMKKKILLAQSLIHDPKILILDEPAENLDPFTRKILYEDLLRLRNEGKTIFISSHVLAELNNIIDEATFIKHGNILFSGKIRPLISERWGEYLINTTDNSTFSKLLIKRGIPSEQTAEGLRAKIGTDAQVSLLMNDLLDKNILLKTFQSHRVDLQQVYNDWIGEVNE